MGTGIKTHKGASKRFKITEKKKVTFKKACNNHLLTNKGKNNKSNRAGKKLSSSFTKQIKTLLPYSN